MQIKKTNTKTNHMRVRRRIPMLMRWFFFSSAATRTMWPDGSEKYAQNLIIFILKYTFLFSF